MKKTLIASLVVCMAASTGCSKKQSSENVDSPVAQTVSNNEQINDNTDESAAPDQEPSPDLEISPSQWADASNELGFNMLRKTSGNAVLSSYSVQRAAGMILEGATGLTAQEMRTALSLPYANNLSKAGLDVENNMIIDSNDADNSDNLDAGNDNGAPVVRIDNRIWVEKTYELLPDYVGRIETGYRAKPVQLDFVNAPDAARTTINDDIAKTTNDKIKNLIPDGKIDSATRVVLTNAVYFKASWFNAFDAKNTKKEVFHAASGDVDVDMMHHKKKHAVYQNDKLTVLELAFHGEYSLYVVLPVLAENDDVSKALENVESTLNATELRKYMEEASVAMVELAMPKFRIEYSGSLKKMFSDFGMNKVFTNDAELTGISAAKDLIVSDIIQKAYIDVNENGTEAAAATAAMMMTRSMIREPEKVIRIDVDHPFVYALVEKTNQTALFVGRVSQF